MVKGLIKLANHLDDKGFVKEANYLDAIIKKSQFDPPGMTMEGMGLDEGVEPERPKGGDLLEHVMWMKAHVKWKNNQDNKQIKKINKSIENRKLNLLNLENDLQIRDLSLLEPHLNNMGRSSQDSGEIKEKIINAVDAYEKNN